MFNHALDAVRYVALNKLKVSNQGNYNISIMSNDGSISKITTGQQQKTFDPNFRNVSICGIHGLVQSITKRLEVQYVTWQNKSVVVNDK